jgi:uncharacterized protein (DUF486 family)
MNNIVLYIVFVIAITIASVLYVLGNYYESTTKKTTPLYYIVLISLLFASLEYIVKIPTYYYYRKYLSPTQLQIIWISITSLMVVLYDTYFLHNKLSSHTKISFAIILTVLISEITLSSSI